MHDAQLHARASELLTRVLALPEAERQTAIDAENDPAVRAEVVSLLQFASESADTADGHGGIGPGTRIGPYRILAPIGRGGSGYVFLAQQTEPIERRVAIKLAPRALIDPGASARFSFEREALQRLDHPNIARVLDAGRTAEGLPFIVVEHVDGPPIAQYCTTHNLGTRERIGLVLQIADAVQHAHQRGLIHRDLSPANILIAADPQHAGTRPIPKLLDFGIARAADSDRGVTMGGPLGTPAFMAPEQASGEEVDTRADVYGLAAVLRALIAGGSASRGTTPDAPAAQPPLPTPLQHTRMPGRPSRAFAADLDRVLSRALALRARDRYPTIAAFAADLQRVLRREPVEAAAPTLAYRTARFYERRRPVVIAAAFALIAAAGGVVGLASGLSEARRQQRAAAAYAESVDLLNRFLLDDLLAGASPEESGIETTAAELVDRAALRVRDRFAARPQLAAEMHHTLGRIYTQLGAFDAAQKQLSEAIALRELHEGADARGTLRSRLALASLTGNRQDFAAAAAAFDELLPTARLVLGADDPALYAALSDFGSVLDSLGEGARAVPLLQEALAGRKRLLGETDAAVLVTLSNLAQAYDGLGEPRRALEMTIEALRIANAQPTAPRMLLIGLNNNIGATYQDLGEYERAAPYLREASDLAQTWLGPDSPTTLTLLANRAGLEARIGDPRAAAELYSTVAEKRATLLGAEAFDTLAAEHGRWNALLLAGDAAAAETGFAQLVHAASRSLGEEHWFAAQCRLSLARAVEEQGRIDEAIGHAQRAAASLERTLGPTHPRSTAARELIARLDASPR